MELFDILLHLGVVTTGFVIYLLIFKGPATVKFSGSYKQPAWNHPFKLLCSRFVVKRWKSKPPKEKVSDTLREQLSGCDEFSFKTSATDGSTIIVKIRKVCRRQAIAEATVSVKLANGTSYVLAQHPETAVGYWDDDSNTWNAGGLKFQVLEPETRIRILFNGLLTDVNTKTTQHATFNFIWASSTKPISYPEDWSDALAAQALALEPWRDDQWFYTLGKYEDGSWLQWGTIQGRFQVFTSEGDEDVSVYLQTRGIKVRAWSAIGYKGLRRVVEISAVAKDGTGVQLRGASYNEVLTLCYSGSVRLPKYAVANVTATNLVLKDFSELPGCTPKVHVLNVSTNDKTYKIILRIASEKVLKTFTGVPYQHETYYHTLDVEIDGEPGTGILELTYATAESNPSIPLAPVPTLKWLSEKEAGPVGYCLPFEAKAAACTNYVGGKGASLALLASVQVQQGYKVPPGYCLTTKALEKHLEVNPAIRKAINEIEAANENYNENNFKEKCKKASDLLGSTPITGDVKEEILSHLRELRKKALEQNLGPELRFAVRSSAVGEDSEALSAAGQNETILGCVSDDDVILGVQKCWGSMFAFISAYYRRQNGQPCLCGGGVVVQALVSPRAAGVMFTRHPRRGDPMRLLITANYGLGESVVSGAVEPDTFEIARGKELTIAKIELGTKTQRVTTSGSGVTMEAVPEAERKTPCVTVSEALQLAELGVAQEQLWGAGRDIEWAILKDDIYLLQARPITSLERWTEEELLHELDFPIMSDDEMLTFANTGEVFPLPITALSHDYVVEPINFGICQAIKSSDTFTRSIALTHNRCTLPLYTTLYKIVPKKIDVTIRMMEVTIFGHTVADDHIHSVAMHRFTPSRWDVLWQTLNSFWMSFSSGSELKQSTKTLKNFKWKYPTNELLAIAQTIDESIEGMKTLGKTHSMTSSGSVTSLFIAMMVLIEGQEENVPGPDDTMVIIMPDTEETSEQQCTDFTKEQSNEINTLLSSGDVLSAEVPHALAKLTRALEDSGRAEEFRAQDPKKALNWLCMNLPQVHNEVLEFLETHGCRAVMEFDLATKPWVLVPEQMMKTLQNMRVTKQENKPRPSDKEIIAALKTPKKSSTRKVLSWVLPLARRNVRHRENSKANLILAIHKLRLEFLKLGELMTRQWYLPDADLIFHFRRCELKQYILTRDPALLKKASLRRQYHPSWCKLKFAELLKGWPSTLPPSTVSAAPAGARLVAASVCGGEVVARACVVKDLSEIGQLQHGDVLITHSTDIGWSPYFPLLTGIVTELGGLISHGAVIAREYGLPCIVGAADATDLFQTGDMVRLSGSNGYIEKVTVENNITNEDVTEDLIVI